MQFLKIGKATTLPDIADAVGERNVSNTLAINGLVREKYIGKQYQEKCKNIIATSDEIKWERQAAILNRFTGDNEVFEEAALQNQSGWKVLSNIGSFRNAIQIPDNVELPNSTDIIGGGEIIQKTVYKKAMDALSKPPHYIDSAIFDNYSVRKSMQIVSGSQQGSGNPFQIFKIPWGDISLYDSIAGRSIDLPVYPETIADSRTAAYTTMQDILYQYEPWQIYTGSGPRSGTFSFHFHRQMWSGNETDGKANQLIRFCQACLYPEFRGSTVNTSIVRLYVKGKTLIAGILTDVSVTWDGPIGLDGWYLECTLDLTITEVADQALNHDVVANLGIIG